MVKNYYNKSSLLFIFLVLFLGSVFGQSTLRVNSMPSNHDNEREGNAIICQPITIWGSVFGGTPPYSMTLKVDGIPVVLNDYVTDPQAYAYGHYFGRIHTFTLLGPRKVRVEVTDADGNSAYSESRIMVYDDPIPQIKVAMRVDKALLFLYKTALNDVATSKNIYWGCTTIPGHFDCYSYGATASSVLSFEEAGHSDLNSLTLDPYAELLKKGMHYLLSKYAGQKPISNHPDGAHGTPVCDVFQGGGLSGNAGSGKGTYLFGLGSENMYANTLGLLALAISRHNAAEAVSSTVEDGTLAGWTYFDVMQDALDLLYWDQGDFALRGAWRYWLANSPDSYDGSIQQWPVLVMLAAKDLWGIQPPVWVMENADFAYQQNLLMPGGGCHYMMPGGSPNPSVGKTGGFLVFSTLFPTNITQPLIDNQLTYIANNYLSCGPNTNEIDGIGWAGVPYQMYSLMKGLTLRNISHINVPGVGYRDWYRDMVAWLTGEQIYSLPAGMCNYPGYRTFAKDYGQRPDGSWQGDATLKCDYLTTAFAVLILLKTVTYLPPVAVIDPPLCTAIMMGCDTLPAPINNCVPTDSAFSISGMMSYHMGAPDFNIVNYYWAVDPPPNFNWSTATITGEHPLLPPFTTPGTHTVCLRVEDNHIPPLYDVNCIEIQVCDTGVTPAPIAKAVPDYLAPCYTVRKDLEMILDGHESYLPANCDTALYWWDIDGNNVYDTIVVNSPFLPVTYHNNGEFRVGLIVMCIHNGDTVMSCPDYACLNVSSDDLLVTYFHAPCRHNYQDSITLTITFQNNPESEHTYHVVNTSLFSNNPLVNGVYLGYSHVITNFAPGQSVTWTVTIANQWYYDSIYVWIDPYMQITEWNEMNNFALVQIGQFGVRDEIYIQEDHDTLVDVVANDMPWPFNMAFQVGLGGFPLHGFALPTLPLGTPIYYLPNTNFNGIDSVPYILRIYGLNENAFCEDTVWLIIHVLPVNDPPYLHLPDIEMCQNDLDSISLLPYAVFHDLDNTLSQNIITHHFITNNSDTSLVYITYTEPFIYFSSGFNDNIDRTFLVEFTAIDSAGAFYTDTLQIILHSFPKITMSDTVYCAGSSVVLNAGNPGATYVWSNGQTTQTIPVGEPGTFSVTVTYAGCSNYRTVQVTEKPVPDVQMSNDAFLVCEGDQFTLHAFSSTLPGPVTYIWYPGGFPGNSLQLTATTSAYYYVIGNLQGCTTKDSLFVEVNARPIIQLTQNQFTICPTDTIIVQVTEDPNCSPATFLWSNGSVSSLLYATPTAPGYYFVTVTCATGCWNKDSVHVLFSIKPDIEPIIPQAICIGDTLFFTPNVSPPAIANACLYQWSNGVTGTTLIASPGFHSTYYITVTYQVCKDTSSVLVDVMPIPKVDLPPYVWLDAGESISLDAGPGMLYYEWSNGLGGQYLTVQDTGKYWVTVKNLMCQNSDTTYIYGDPNIFVPNAFTPNNDGTNDIFYAYSAADLKIHLWIYTRWGECVFESRDLYQGWDGKYKGDKAPIDVYTWVLEYIYTTPGPYYFQKDGTKSGMVVLIR